MSINRTACVAAAMLAASSAAAEFRTVQEEAAFLDLVQGRDLTRLGVSLRVTSDGRITGRALGFDVNGEWNWQDGYFCRTIDYGQGTLPNNCQQVKVEDATLRFISDRGEGKHADLTLR